MSSLRFGSCPPWALLICLLPVAVRATDGEGGRATSPPTSVRLVIHGSPQEPVALAEAQTNWPRHADALSALRCASADDIPVLHTSAATLVAVCEAESFAWVPEEAEWRELDPQLEGDEHIHGIEIDPAVPGRIVMTGSQRFVTDDYGVTWQIEESIELAPKARQSATGSPALSLTRCFALSPGSFRVGAGFSTQSFRVSVLRQGCGSWRSELVVRPREANILVLTGGFSGTASGNVSFNVLANGSSSLRSQSIRVITQFGSLVVPVTQQSQRSTSGSCSYTFEPQQANVGRGVETAGFNVRTAGGCSWRALQPSRSWVLVTGGFNGSGNGRITIQTQFNTGRARVETIRVETPRGTFPLYVQQAGSI